MRNFSFACRKMRFRNRRNSGPYCLNAARCARRRPGSARVSRVLVSAFRRDELPRIVRFPSGPICRLDLPKKSSRRWNSVASTRDARALPRPRLATAQFRKCRPLALSAIQRGIDHRSHADSLGKRDAAQKLRQAAPRWLVRRAVRDSKTWYV